MQYFARFQLTARSRGPSATAGLLVRKSLLALFVAYRSNDFIVGLTNVSPNVSRPTIWKYTVCGQYPGAVPSGETVSVHCQDNLPPARYVIVQFPGTDYTTFCELEVLVIGMHSYLRINLLFTVHMPIDLMSVATESPDRFLELSIGK